MDVTVIVTHATTLTIPSYSQTISLCKQMVKRVKWSLQRQEFSMMKCLDGGAMQFRKNKHQTKTFTGVWTKISEMPVIEISDTQIKSPLKSAYHRMVFWNKAMRGCTSSCHPLVFGIFPIKPLRMVSNAWMSIKAWQTEWDTESICFSLFRSSLH